MKAMIAATSLSASRNAGMPLSTRPSRSSARTLSPLVSSRTSGDFVRLGPVSPPIASRPWQKPHCAAKTRCPVWSCSAAAGTCACTPLWSRTTTASDSVTFCSRFAIAAESTMSDAFAPRPEHKFSFGLWTVGNRGRDPFGDAVRDPLPPEDAVALLGEAGAWGGNLPDNDLVPLDAAPPDRDRIVKGFQRACERHGVVVPMATVNLFFDPVFRDGAFTANDPRVRAYAVQKTMTAMDLGAELGARIFVLWGGREGTETDASRRPDEAIKHLRDAIDFLCEYSIDRKYGFRFALEAKPNEPRSRPSRTSR